MLNHLNPLLAPANILPADDTHEYCGCCECAEKAFIKYQSDLDSKIKDDNYYGENYQGN